MGEQVLAKRAPGWLLGHPCEDLKERFKGSERYVRNMSHCRFDKSFQELTDHGAAERERETRVDETVQFPIPDKATCRTEQPHSLMLCYAMLCYLIERRRRQRSREPR